MSVKTIAWGDGTSDKITLTFSGAVGDSSMDVASDPNASLNQRTKVIALKDSLGITRATLTIEQKPRSRAYSVAYSGAYK